MVPRQQNAIREAIEWMQNRQPELSRIILAIGEYKCLTDASEDLGFPKPEAFTERYDEAIACLVHQLELLGYPMPGSQSLEMRIGPFEPERNSLLDLPIPSREIVHTWYGDHILHEALKRFQSRDHSGIRQLWDRFPESRLEVEIAFVLNSLGSHEVNLTPIALSVSPADNAPDVQAPKEFIEVVLDKAMPAAAVAISLFVLFTLALRPPSAGRAVHAISASLEDGLFSSQGIFNFSNDALKEAEPPGTKSEVKEPVVSTSVEPKPRPRPVIARPERPKIALTSVTDAPRNLDITGSTATWAERPSISAPDLVGSSDRSNYFGNRPEVEIARRERTLRPGIGERPGMPGGSSFSLPKPIQEEPAQGNLKGYRPAGRIGFSSLQTTRGLSGELVRLTRIERYVSMLESSRSMTLDGAKVSFGQDRAQVNFPDGVAMIVTFSLGRLDDIRIFLKSDIIRELKTEKEVVRGIQLLSDALTH